ncbi:Rho termination factor N-terminal domain-containing protein [Amycolatopsis cynarae]|uniref:Rho termination factor N-terminal domain-containing protein n=1 Tax=Amycolatopsis cynarae TaxID=2995223 RepID=A0ABY7ASS1_9PSEU|nr:Rho termination factor N-terminal domain-containing protein [Amycolatopsis sp. HUAS 11-8]WAL62987.1 Rho termination factor N-terminal domain-containing protein [Amycolatopsis sp. HUAS 11-8]
MAKTRQGKQTLTESELEDMKVDELRAKAREIGLSGTSHMHKGDLVKALAEAGGRETKGAPTPRSEGSHGGGARPGSEETKSVKYAQEISSPEEEPEREGRSLVTTNHDVIRGWAERRDAQPATVPGTEHGGRPGVLRFDFPGYGGKDLQHIGWDEWFETFDQRGLNFIYQEERTDGTQSNFFRLENPDREDA